MSLEIHFQEFDFRGFIDFICYLGDEYKMDYILFNPDKRELFTDFQLRHIAPHHDINNKQGFTWAWKQMQDKVRNIEFDLFTKDKTKSIRMSIELDAKFIYLNQAIGISPAEIKRALKDNMKFLEEEGTFTAGNKFGENLRIEKLEIIKGDKFEQHGKENKIVNNKPKKEEKSWKNPRIIVPAVAMFFAALISAPWWSNLFPLLFKDDVDNSQISINGPVENNSNVFNILLRPLESLETGKKIGELPSGVYFFGSPLGIKFEIEDPENDFLQATNKYSNNYSFELQKIDSRYYLVGFIGDEAYSNIGSVNSEKSLNTILFPNLWGGAIHPIAIPFDAIYTINYRTINVDEKTDIQVFDVGFKEVIDKPEIHTK
ncbi:MAG: hypothetical protein WC697_01560 [Patescibacteria group bacterium]|jgi:hypothetical protein